MNVARLPTNKEASKRLRDAMDAVGQRNFGRLVDQSRMIHDALEGGRLDELRTAGANLNRLLQSVAPANQFRTGHHKLLEAIGQPLHSPVLTSLSAPGPATAGQPAAIETAADLGQLVRSARKRMGMTQQRFADLAGVGRRFLSELEGGKASLEIGRVLAVCKAAGIDLYARPR